MIQSRIRPVSIVADSLLFWLVAIATFAGIIMAQDAGYARSIRAQDGMMAREFLFQILFAGAGIVIGWWAAARDSDAWKRWAAPLFVLSFCALLYVHFFGKVQNGAQRWVSIGPIDVQPAEFVKLTAILFLASIIANLKPLKTPTKILHRADYLDRIIVPRCKRILPYLFVFGASYLIELEPDLGTAGIIIAITFAMMFLGGVPLRTLLAFLLIGGLLVTLLVIKQPYRLDRIVNHNSRWSNELVDDVGYQTTHSETGMAAGGLIGVGIGIGHAKHMLPAATTDFVMATVGEEFGFLGSIAVIGLLALITWRLFWLSRNAQSQFAGLVLAGVAVWIGLQTCVNVMMANGFIPAIGIPLPFISSGGSSLLALWLAVGVSQSMTLATVKEEYANSRNRWRNRGTRLSRA